MPTVKILNLCSSCADLVVDSFNAKVARQEEHGICEMCGAKGIVRAVKIDGKIKEQRDRSVPEEGIP